MIRSKFECSIFCYEYISKYRLFVLVQIDWVVKKKLENISKILVLVLFVNDIS